MYVSIYLPRCQSISFDSDVCMYLSLSLSLYLPTYQPTYQPISLSLTFSLSLSLSPFLLSIYLGQIDPFEIDYEGKRKAKAKVIFSITI